MGRSPTCSFGPFRNCGEVIICLCRAAGRGELGFGERGGEEQAEKPGICGLVFAALDNWLLFCNTRRLLHVTRSVTLQTSQP